MLKNLISLALLSIVLCQTIHRVPSVTFIRENGTVTQHNVTTRRPKRGSIRAALIPQKSECHMPLKTNKIILLLTFILSL